MSILGPSLQESTTCKRVKIIFSNFSWKIIFSCRLPKSFPQWLLRKRIETGLAVPQSLQDLGFLARQLSFNDEFKENESQWSIFVQNEKNFPLPVICFQNILFSEILSITISNFDIAYIHIILLPCIKSTVKCKPEASNAFQHVTKEKAQLQWLPAPAQNAPHPIVVQEI